MPGRSSPTSEFSFVVFLSGMSGIHHIFSSASDAKTNGKSHAESDGIPNIHVGKLYSRGLLRRALRRVKSRIDVLEI